MYLDKKRVSPVNTTSHHSDKTFLTPAPASPLRACVYIEWKRKKEPTLPTLPTPKPPPTPPGGRGAGCLQGLKVQQNYSDSPSSGRGWGVGWVWEVWGVWDKKYI